MKKKNSKKISREELRMIIQTVIESLLISWFLAWCITEGNETIVTFLTELQKSGITKKVFFDLWKWLFPICLVLIGMMNLGLYFIVTGIKNNKKKK